MSYIALARKWRPRQFSQLVGQENICKALANSLQRERLHHAYLFTGTRGVGKTSVARIFAKALNCESGISAEPCLNCETCHAIEQGCFVDLIEIDGASKTRVEDTRDLLENIQYMPTNGRFKIYLIDEVHMLSQHSFNALLKTLEEPPSHVKFLLATTDPQKLPMTVLSRCLQFSLKPIAASTIEIHLQEILKQESISFEPRAVTLIATAAKGSLRDALSLLDQVIAIHVEDICEADVKKTLGYTPEDYAAQTLQALVENKTDQLIKLSRNISEAGGNFHYVLDQMLFYLHQMLISKSLSHPQDFLALDQSIQKLAQQMTAEDIQLFYQIGLKAKEDILFAPTLEIGFEMTLLRMLTFQPAVFQKKPSVFNDASQNPKEETIRLDMAAKPVITSEHTYNRSHQKLTDSSTGFQAKFADSIEFQKQSNDSAHEDKTEDKPPQQDVENHHASDEADLLCNNDNWHEILPRLKLSGLALNAAEHAEFEIRQGSEYQLCVATGHLSIFTEKVRQRIQEALRAYYQDTTLKLVINTAQKTRQSPAQQKQEKQTQMLETAKKSLQDDPFLQDLQEMFSAELVENSITSTKDEL